MNHVPNRGPGLRVDRASHDGDDSSGNLKGHSNGRADARSPRLRRLIIAACFLATFIAYVERTGFSVAYTAAAKDHAVSEATKGTVLSSFFWGYAVSQVKSSCERMPHHEQTPEPPSTRSCACCRCRAAGRRSAGAAAPRSRCPLRCGRQCPSSHPSTRLPAPQLRQHESLWACRRAC